MKTNGDAVLTCRNHPTYRWTKTKYTLPGHTREFIGAGVLMFDGEEGGKPSCAYNLSERRLAELTPENRERYLANWTPECNCPVSDLEFVRWCDDAVPTTEEAKAFIEGLADRITTDAQILTEGR